jgi:4-amino-4-deoxy-L-arabinose transferase-like glycosyltransferase
VGSSSIARRPLTRSERWTLAGIVAAGAAVRFSGLAFGLPHTQARPDETFIIGNAFSFLRGDFAPRFYDYPWLSLWVTALLYLGYFVVGGAAGWFHSIADLLASWPVHWEPFYLIIRAASALAGTATVLVVFRLARNLWDVRTGLVAALFMSVAFLPVRDSHFGTTDTAMTLLIVAAVAVLMEAHRTARRRRFALAGFLSGLAAATKYNAVLLGASILASQGVQIVQSRSRGRMTVDGRILLFGIPFALAFAIGVPFIFLDTQRFLHAARELMDSMQVGSTTLNLDSGWIHHLKLSLRYGLGLPLLGAGLAGVVLMFVIEPATAVVLLSFPIVYYGVAGSIRNLFFRYAIPVVPFLCVAAARLVCVAIARTADRWTPSRTGVWPAVATAVVSLLIAGPSAWSCIEFDRVVRQTDNRVLLADWFKDHVPAHSSVVQTGSHYGYAQFDERLDYVLWTWREPPGVFLVNGAPATGRPDWIVVQDSPLPSDTQDIVKGFLQHGYALMAVFHGMDIGPDHVFDQQDAFYVPFAGFTHVRRPGPNFVVYRRVGPDSR